MDPEPDFDETDSDEDLQDSQATEEAQVQFPTMPYLDGENLMFPVECKLKELPKIATINGLLVDSTTGGTVLDARVVITDKLERSLELMVDPDGSFQFRNVPFGRSRIVAHAPGFLSTVIPVDLQSRNDREIHVVMNPRPEVLDAQISDDFQRIDLSKQLQFIGDTTDIAADSMVVVEEVALLLDEHAEITDIEIVVHTDDSGPADVQQRLSQERAVVIKQLLFQIASESRATITARGVGQEQPLTPNNSEEARRLNERVEFKIKIIDSKLP
jgi:outer membrane protein OmpA-like peptidoglycan-associated protein